MLIRKQELITYVDNLNSEYERAVEAAPLLLSDAGLRFAKQKVDVHTSVNNGELLVPLVGGFSAGKSTALNGIIGSEVLPVAVTAETAIPAELRYSVDEHIMALTVDGDYERHDISALPQLSASASCYEVVKVYLNRQALKDIEPFTLIDMPGFDSTLEHHNKAILRYLNKGAYYLYLVSAGDGALKQQDLRRLDEIVDMGRQFKIFLTKKDLSPESELQKVCTYICDQVQTAYGTDIQVGCIDLDGAAQLLDALNKADPDQLFNNLFVGQVKDLYYMASTDINTAISALKKTKEEGRQQIEKLECALSTITEERNSSLESIKSGSVVDAESRILSRIECELQSSVDGFADMARSGKDTLNRVISDVVRSTLVSELQHATGQISNEVMRSFSNSLNIQVNTEFNMSEDWLKNIIAGIQNEVMDALLGTTKSKVSKGGNSIIDLLSGLALTIPNPVVRIILNILPGIVGTLFQNANEKREKALMVDAIRGRVIPSVLLQMRPNVSVALSQVAESMMQAVAEQFEVKISAQKTILENAQIEVDSEATVIERSVSILESVRKNINAMTENNII